MKDKRGRIEQYSYFLNGRTDGQALFALVDVIESGLSPEILESAQVRLFDGSAETLKERLGFIKIDGVSLLQSHRLIEFPYFKEDGGASLFEYKPFPALDSKDGDTPRKYLHPKGVPPLPYILPSVWSVKGKPNKPLWITEGVKKVLKLTQHQRSSIGIGGVWNFRAGKNSDEPESKYLWKDLEEFNWTGRTVHLGFDSDLWVNPMVRRALYELAFTLYDRGAVIRFPIWHEEKGIDDALATTTDPEKTLADLENTAQDMEAFIMVDHRREIMDALFRVIPGMRTLNSKTLITTIAHRFNMKQTDITSEIARRRSEETKKNADPALLPYFIDEDGAMCRMRRERDGSETPQRLANFTAQIKEEVYEDNGLETSTRFLIAGRTKEREFKTIKIPASQFAALNWVVNHWGNDAIIEPGQNIKDHLRYAIQKYSELEGCAKKTLYTHTGWRKVNGEWCYLCANGAIGGKDIAVELPGEFLEMNRYCLPQAPENEVEAIQASLSFLHVGKHEITYPAYAYTFLAPLTSILTPTPNFSAYFYGETGSFKSTIATLLLSHFGDFSISGLSNFSSSANQIEKRTFILKDTLYILDDYHPSTQQKEATAKEAIAQRLIRASSNRTGRERLNPDTTEKGKYAPRGMLIITGEELVQLQSTLARLMVVEFNEGDIDQKQLNDVQRNSRLLPHAMSSYILWTKDHMDHIRTSFPEWFLKMRENTVQSNAHKKINEQAAYLQFSFELLLSWAKEKGAIDENDAGIALELAKDIFVKVACRQSERIDEDDPVKLFFGIIDSMLIGGKAHMRDRYSGRRSPRAGKPPDDFIGYYDETHYLLLPTAIWHVVTSYLKSEGRRFHFERINPIYSALEKQHSIERTKDGKHTHVVKINGTPMRVLKLKRKGNVPLEFNPEPADDVEQE